MVTADLVISSSLSSLLRRQLQDTHNWLQGTMQDVSSAIAHWQPPGMAHPIAAQYAHTVLREDFILNGLVRGATPLMASSWADLTGLSELPLEGRDWDEWARRVRVDLPALHAYAGAVYQASDAYLSTLLDDELMRQVDLSPLPLGEQPLHWVLSQIVIGHNNTHCGEISCLKGIQNLRGYPG